MKTIMLTVLAITAGFLSSCAPAPQKECATPPSPMKTGTTTLGSEVVRSYIPKDQKVTYLRVVTDQSSGRTRSAECIPSKKEVIRRQYAAPEKKTKTTEVARAPHEQAPTQVATKTTKKDCCPPSIINTVVVNGNDSGNSFSGNTSRTKSAPVEPNTVQDSPHGKDSMGTTYFDAPLRE
jgi:hypothetical protein